MIENQYEAGVGAARTERADRNGSMQDAPGHDRFDLTRNHTHAQRAAHQMLHGARRFGSKQLLERMRLASSGAEHAPHGGIQSQNSAVSVEKNHTRRNNFQQMFHQLTP